MTNRTESPRWETEVRIDPRFLLDPRIRDIRNGGIHIFRESDSKKSFEALSFVSHKLLWRNAAIVPIGLFEGQSLDSLRKNSDFYVRQELETTLLFADTTKKEVYSDNKTSYLVWSKELFRVLSDILHQTYVLRDAREKDSQILKPPMSIFVVSPHRLRYGYRQQPVVTDFSASENELTLLYTSYEHPRTI